MARFVLLLVLALAPQEPALKSLDDAMEAQLRDLKVPGGALAVAKDGKLLYAKGYGRADEEAPVKADSRMCSTDCAARTSGSKRVRAASPVES